MAVAVCVVQLVGTHFAGLHQPERYSLDALGIALLVAGPAALLFRRRWPRAVLAVVFATTLAYWVIGYVRGPIFLALIVAFATAIDAGYRRTAIASLVAGYLAFLWLGALLDRDASPSIGSSLGLAAWFLVGKSLTSDLVVDTAGFGGRSGGTGLSPQLATAIAKVPDIQDVVGIGGGSARHAGQQRDTKIFVNLRRGGDLRSARAAITSIARPYRAPRVQDRAQFRTTAASGVNTILGLVYVMLALAIVIAFMGIANTLSLVVYERTRELGLLRAVGQTRRQTRSMVRWESVMIAVFGTLGGVSLGTFLAWALVKSSSSTTLAVFAVPPVQLTVFVVIGAVAGVLVAIRPARRAARLQILQAIATE